MTTPKSITTPDEDYVWVTEGDTSDEAVRLRTKTILSPPLPAHRVDSDTFSMIPPFEFPPTPHEWDEMSPQEKYPPAEIVLETPSGSQSELLHETPPVKGIGVVTTPSAESGSQSELDAVLEAETGKTEELPDIRPFILQLNRNQTPNDVKNVLRQAEKMYVKEKTSEIRIVVKGYEAEKKHPALITNAKKKYAKAIELGLLGFLLKHGYSEIAVSTYAVAHCRARIAKVTEGDKVVERLRFTGFKKEEYIKTANASILAFEKLFVLQ